MFRSTIRVDTRKGITMDRVSNKEQKQKVNKIPMKVKLGWSASGFSLAVSYALVGSISFYATDVMGLNIGIIGILLLISKVFDGFTDLVMGAVIDKTHTRIGKARPWAIAVVPYWIVCALMFSAPQMGQTAGYIYFFALYTLMNSVFATMYYCADAPHMANALEDSSQSISLLSFSSVIATIGGLAGGIVLPQLIAAAGTDLAAWRRLAWGIALPMMVIGSLRFFLVKEIRNVDDGTGKTPSLRELLGAIRQNKYIYMVAAMVFISYLATGLSGQVGTYYNLHILGDIGVGSLLSLALVTIVIVMILSPILARKFTLKRTIDVLMIIGIVGALLRLIAPSNLLLTFISTCMTSISFQVYYGVASAQVIDCMDYGEWKSGQRVEGLMGAMSSVMNKVGNGIGIAIASAMMAMAGYDGTSGAVSGTARGMIIALTTVVPAILGVIFLLIARNYDLESKIGQIRKELAARQQPEQAV